MSWIKSIRGSTRTVLAFWGEYAVLSGLLIRSFHCLAMLGMRRRCAAVPRTSRRKTREALRGDRNLCMRNQNDEAYSNQRSCNAIRDSTRCFGLLYGMLRLSGLSCRDSDHEARSGWRRGASLRVCAASLRSGRRRGAVVVRLCWRVQATHTGVFILPDES